MKIIILASRLPYPEISGGIKRLISICEYLRSNGHTLTLLTFVDSKEDIKNIVEGRLDYLFENISYVRMGFFLKTYNLVSAVFVDQPLQVLLFRSKKMRRLIEKINKTNRQDMSICHMIRASEYQSLIEADQKIIELTDSLSLNYMRKADNYIGYSIVNFAFRALYSIEARRLKEAELACLVNNDKAVLVSDVDRDFILSGSKSTESINNKLVTIPLGIPDDLFVTSIKEYDSNTIVFVGKMDYAPNEDAAIHFVKYVFPRVKLAIPNARFKIVGADPSDRVKKLALNESSITATGRVDSIIDHVASAALSVALMQSGAGMQTKILESIALGVPVVTNNLGFEGINLLPNIDLMVADNDDDAVAMICELMSDSTKRKQLSVAGKDSLFKKYSSSHIFANYVSQSQ